MAYKLIALILATCLVLTVAEYMDEFDMDELAEEMEFMSKRDPIAALMAEFEQDEEMEKRGTGTGRFYLCRQPVSKAVCKCDKTKARQSSGFRKFCRMV